MIKKRFETKFTIDNNNYIIFIDKKVDVNLLNANYIPTTYFMKPI